MISHENKCIFIHIPKVAGTSIIRVFSDKHPEPKAYDPMPFAPDDDKFDPPPPHLRATDHIKFGLATQEQFDSYFKFAFTRNPWDRIVSEYKYRGYGRRHSFKDYLFRHLPKPHWSDNYCHIIPQYDYIYDRAGNNLLDFVGKFENLAADFAHVCKQLSITQTTLPHTNKSLSIFTRRDNNLLTMLRTFRDLISLQRRRNTFPHYTQYYDQETRDFVARIYQKDIEAFGYDFGA